LKKYILFDNDGVLVHTEPWYFKASQRALKEFFDLNFEKQEYMHLMVHGGAVWQKALALGFSEDEVSIARDKRNQYYQEYLSTKDLLIPNVKEVLKELSRNYKMAIVTTSRRVDFEILHKNTGILEFMEFVLCEGEYEKAKPHPDPYLKALEIFGAKSHEAIVIEDSQRGLTSATNAQIECAIVHNEFCTHQDFSSATYKIKNLKQLIDLLN
jgi:HAD superfamily hydrolase (TIGR01509 family)